MNGTSPQKPTFRVDGWSAGWRESSSRMVACEKRMVDRDNDLFTGSARWVDDLGRRFSKHVFPGGVS